jgi:hypothetical protein
MSYHNDRHVSMRIYLFRELDSWSRLWKKGNYAPVALLVSCIAAWKHDTGVGEAMNVRHDVLIRVDLPEHILPGSGLLIAGYGVWGAAKHACIACGRN